MNGVSTSTRQITRAALLSVAAWLGCEAEAAPPMYQMVEVAMRDITLSARADGLIEPVRTVEVKSKASGEIFDVAVDVGDIVRRGQLLVQVDQRVPRNSLIQAEADSVVAQASLENAESQLARAQRLYETGAVTEEEYEQRNLDRANAYAEVIRARRTLEDARISFEDTEVRAPITGVILTRTVEVGTVIAAVNRAVGGGAVLLTMANLDTVQVRTLVHELDVGKIQPGMEVSVDVDAYPGRPFDGSVLKIEPSSVEDQGRTMYPVLIRIPNPQGQLRPGMNSKVEIHIGARSSTAAIPNAALRSERDLTLAAQVVGLPMDTILAQIARARGVDPAQVADGNTINVFGGQIPLPEGITAEQAQAVFAKVRSGGGPQSLNDDERAIFDRLRRSMGRPQGGGGARAGDAGGDRPGDGGGPGPNGNGARRVRGTPFQFGGQYIVFVMRDGRPTATPVRTGMTDLEYAEVIEGLTVGDTVLLLPSTSLLRSQEEMQERMQRFNRGLPGIG